jgi:hypothetical protein
VSKSFTILALLAEAKGRVERGDMEAALWRLVDAAGLCGVECKWDMNLRGLSYTGLGYAVVRATTGACGKCVNATCSCD